MKNNKKITLWIFAIILVVIIISGFYIYINAPESKTNTKLINDYPMLKNNDYSKYMVSESLNRNYLKNLFNITNGELTYFSQDEKPVSGRGYYCKNKKAEEIEYYSYSQGVNIYGGWEYVIILDCGDIYWILKLSDSGFNPLHGPFTK